VTAPLILLVAILIKRDSEGPVFFHQERLGRDMRPFDLLKFRTMTVDTDPAEHLAYIRQTMTPTRRRGRTGCTSSTARAP